MSNPAGQASATDPGVYAPPLRLALDNGGRWAFAIEGQSGGQVLLRVLERLAVADVPATRVTSVDSGYTTRIELELWAGQPKAEVLSSRLAQIFGVETVRFSRLS